MKRTRDAYYGNYMGAVQRRRNNIRYRSLDLNKAPFTEAQYKAMEKIATKQAKRAITRNSDKKATQDVSGLISVTSSGGIGDLLTNLTRGDDSLNNFSGSKIMPYQLTFNWNIDFTPNIDETGSHSASMRFIILQDRGDIFASNVASYMNLGLSPTYPVLALVNWENNENWTCLYDSGPLSVSTNTGTQGGNGMPLVKSGQVIIPKKDLRTVFYGDGDAGVTTERNTIRVLFWSDSSVAPNPTFYYQSEIDFTDGA